MVVQVRGWVNISHRFIKGNFTTIGWFSTPFIPSISTVVELSSGMP
jgi:hypothetical protein